MVGTLHHHVQQRVDAARQAQLLELLDRGQRVTGLQQLEHFVEQAALRHFLQQLAFDQRLGGLGFELEAQRLSLAAKRTARMMRTGSSR
jgi:hypothetical protein